MVVRGLDRQWTLNSVPLYRSVGTKIFTKETISDIRGIFQLCSFKSSYDCTTMQQKFWFLVNFTQSKHSSSAWTSELWCDWLKDDQHIEIYTIIPRCKGKRKQMSRIQMQRHVYYLACLHGSSYKIPGLHCHLTGLLRQFLSLISFRVFFWGFATFSLSCFECIIDYYWS